MSQTESTAKESRNTGPANLEAEHALLGIALFDNDAIAQIEALTADHFSEPFHGRVWSAIRETMAAGRIADPVTLRARLEPDPAFEEMGGIGYLADLVNYAPPGNRAPDFAAEIHDAALRRRLIEVAYEYVNLARSPLGGMSAYDVLSAVEKDVGDLARGAEPTDRNLIDARSSVEATIGAFEVEAEHGRPKGLMTGLRCFDRRLRGLRPGHLIVVAGRPSMGKTALARQAAFGAASRNPKHQIAFFALEMDRRELDERTLSQLSHEAGDGIPYQQMSGERLSPVERRRLYEMAWKVPRNLIIDDSSSLSVEHVRRRIWSMKRKGPVGAAFIDYLQIMDRPKSNGRNDAAVIGEMTASLKRLAREAEIAIVLLSQINRGVESREDKRPQLSDLKESGSIEQDANSVLFPFREVYYLERAEPKENSPDHLKWEEEVECLKRRMDVMCAKQRGGPVGTDRQVYFAEYDSITDDREDRS